MSTAVANGSSSRTGTTIRALTSTISRSSPSIPPAGQVYEPLVKSLFRHRLKFVLSLSALASWVITGSWAWWQTRRNENLGVWATLSFPFSPSILFMTLLYWTTVALPVTVLRKVFLTTRRSSATSPLNIVKRALAQNSTRMAFATYALSAVASLAFHAIMAYQYESGDPKLSVFVKSKKHPHYLNGRLVFLFFAQLGAAGAFSFRGAMTDRFAYRWARGSSSKYMTVLTSSVIATFFACLAVIAAAVLFTATRISLPILYKIPLVSLVLRPFTAHFLKGQWTLFLPFVHLPLLLRAWSLAFTTFLNWEIADSLFEHVVSETTPVSAFSADPNTTVVSGVTSTDKVFQYFAYCELRELATDSSSGAATRRAAFFGDQKSSLNLWGFFTRQSLLLLGEHYQLFLRRGQPAVLPPLPTSVPIVASAPHIATPVPLLRTRIFKTTPESPGHAALDALASDGPIAKAFEVGADATHVPELFRSVETKVLSSPIAEEAKKNMETAKGLGGRIQSGIVVYATSIWTRHAPGMLREAFGALMKWWQQERKNKAVEASLPYRELDVVVVDVLSHLVCASLTEDRYGSVQRDIPKILEAFISFLTAAEEYQAEIASLQKPFSSTHLSAEEERTKLEIEKAQEVLRFMGEGLKEGVARIVYTFGDKLLAFKFPPRISQKLQIFLDHSS